MNKKSFYRWGKINFNRNLSKVIEDRGNGGVLATAQKLSITWTQKKNTFSRIFLLRVVVTVAAAAVVEVRDSCGRRPSLYLFFKSGRDNNNSRFLGLNWRSLCQFVPTIKLQTVALILNNHRSRVFSIIFVLAENSQRLFHYHQKTHSNENQKLKLWTPFICL